MHLGDSIVIFILALVLFGPKKLPEIARQIGKLMAEFRRASSDFRSQIDEELRTMERAEREKKLEAERAAAAAAVATPAAELAPTAATDGAPRILPPTTGEPVSTANPFAVSAPAEAEDHPLLQVAEIPHDPNATATGLAVAQANAALLNGQPLPTPKLENEAALAPSSSEAEQAPLTHG